MTELSSSGFVLTVGQPYMQDVTNWPTAAEYNYRGKMHELRIFYDRFTTSELDAYSSGEARFAFTVSGDVLFFAWQFGGEPWSDSTYSIHLVHENERYAPPAWAEPDARAMLSTVCVESETGLVAALRVCTFSPHFTRLLHRKIREQLARPFPGDEDYMRQCLRFYAAHTSEDIAKIALATCKGGD